MQNCTPSVNFQGIKITGALERFDEGDFKQFLAELKKQKLTLSLVQQDEWEDYFAQYKTECNRLSEPSPPLAAKLTK